jgi:hypothetical protein
LYVRNDKILLEADTTAIFRNPKAYSSLCDAVMVGTDSVLISTIDRNSFCRYALAIWFFQVPDPWGYHITLSKTNLTPWKILSEHYDFIPRSAFDNDWNTYITSFPNQAHVESRKTLPWMITMRLLESDPDYLCLLFEDELNTTYRPDRTTPIALKKMDLLRPCIAECSKAWYPNGWPDSIHWERNVSDIVPFLTNRPTGIAAALPKIFLSGKDTLLTPSDMSEVNVVFDSIQGKGAVVKLNSLELTASFSGKYYPRPELHVELKYDDAKYQFVKWLEFPGYPSAFNLSASHPIKLTPVLKLKKAPH